jgi:hypothetical protein
VSGTEAFLIGNGKIERIEGRRGTTPACPGARFKKGDVVQPRKLKALAHFPKRLVVLVPVPPGFSPDDALADLMDRPRPLMKQVGSKGITYLACDIPSEVGSVSQTYLCKEGHLFSAPIDHIEIGVIHRAPTDHPLPEPPEGEC